MEGTFYAENDYNSNREWLDQLRDGQHYWEGVQYLACYDDDDEDNMDMITRAWVQVHNCKEGPTGDDSKFRHNRDEGSSTASIVRLWRFFEDIFMEEGGSLSYATALGTAALAISLLQV